LDSIEKTMERIHTPISIHGGSYGREGCSQQNASSQPLMLAAALLAIYVVPRHAV